MPSLAQLVDRVGRIGGAWNWLPALAGLGGLYAGLAFAERAFAPAAPAPARLAAAAFQVANPAGKRIGTLAIDYPRKLRENQDAEVKVRYTAEGEWRARFADPAGARPTIKLTIHLAAARLALEPAPASYTFDNARILAGGDGRSWILSPQREGDYTLLARSTSSPPASARSRSRPTGRRWAGPAPCRCRSPSRPATACRKSPSTSPRLRPPCSPSCSLCLSPPRC